MTQRVSHEKLTNFSFINFVESFLNVISTTLEGEKLTTLGRGEVETFIGTKGHVTDWHTDFQVRTL
jgi:hypothetical protein